MRIPFSGSGLPRLESGSFGSIFADGLMPGVALPVLPVGANTVAASSFSSGARRPATQSFAVLIHLLVA